MIKLLVTDLDDTLYSWLGFFVPAFYAMAEEVAAITHVDFRVILSEYKMIHQLTGSVETPFATLQLPSVKRAFPDMTEEQMKEQLDSAFHRFYSVRKRQLKLFPGVRETLEEIFNSGIRIVGYTESASENGVYRLKQLDIESYFSCIYVSNSWRLQGKEDSLLISKKAKVVTGKKPNVDVLGQIVADQNTTTNSVLYIGDSLTKDMFSIKDARFKQEGFVAEVKEFYTDLINRYVSDPERRLAVFDPASVYLPTKKIGKNNPRAEEIKADHAARQEWNRTADMALLTGISEAEILEVKQSRLRPTLCRFYGAGLKRKSLPF